MANLSTSYLGIELDNPIVVGSCSLSKNVETIKQIEGAGAGALVLKSLFEEQVQLEQEALRQELERYQDLYAEAQSLFPPTDNSQPKEHLYWVERAKKAVSIPVIASLNAVYEPTWVDYASQLAETGVDALELNFYSVPLDPSQSSADIEGRELAIFEKVRAAVKIPIAVKLHSHYTHVLNMTRAFDERGANGVVLFNRLFQPDIDVESEQESQTRVLSSGGSSSEALRWTGILHGQLKGDIIASSGIATGEDVVKMLLAGASSVQVVSALYANGIKHIGTMKKELGDWMGRKGYDSLSDFRGKASKKNVADPWAFERAQYLKALLGFD